MKINAVPIPFILLSTVFSVMILLPMGESNDRIRDIGDHFDTAREIPTDGTVFSDMINYETDMIDFLKLYLSPPDGQCINTTIEISATTPGTNVFVGIFTPDYFMFHNLFVSGNGPSINYSFWAPVAGYYYLSLATLDIVDANYNIQVSKQIVDHIPDYNNNIDEAVFTTPATTYKGRVNRTSDPYDIHKVYLNSNDTNGDGINVHLNNFTDLTLAVYDPANTQRGLSNTIMSDNPGIGETVRFVANQTGFHYIVITFDEWMPQDDYANYDLTISVTAGQPLDEDWCIEGSTPVFIGTNEGSFNSEFDEYDHFNIELHEGDSVNVSALVTETEDWDMDILFFNDRVEEFDTNSYGGRDYFGIGGIDILENGTYYICFCNYDLAIFNYTFLITTNGVHFGNTRPMTLNNSNYDFSMFEDTVDSTSLDLCDIFNRGEPRSFSSPSHDAGINNLTLEIDPSGQISCSPKKDWHGTETVLFRANDFFNITLDQIVNITVLPVNDPPTFISINGISPPGPFLIEADEDRWMNFSVNISDADDETDDINLSIVNGTSNLVINRTTKSLSYYNDGRGSGRENFTIQASDGDLNTTVDLSFIINRKNDPPAPQAICLKAGGFNNLSVELITAPARDEEGDAVMYKWSFGDGDVQKGLSLLEVEHTYRAPGSYVVQLNTSDGEFSGFTELRVNVTGMLQDDSDGDGVPDPDDAFPLDPSATMDSDGDGYPDSWNPGMTEYDSTTSLSLDTFPFNSLYHADSDEDGMPDSWEITYGLNPNNSSDADGDEDYDNITNLFEFQNGTNPLTNLYDPVEEYEKSNGWRTERKEFTDVENDDIIWYWRMVSLVDARLEGTDFGEMGRMDLVNLVCWSTDTHLLIEMTTREEPMIAEEIDILDPDFDFDIFEPSFAYKVYLVDPGHLESEYGKDPQFGEVYIPESSVSLVLEYGSLSSFFFFYKCEVNGNTISWEVPIESLELFGLADEQNFEIFATAEYTKINEDDTIDCAYDSVGEGAFSLEIAPDKGASSKSSGSGSFTMILYIVLVVIIIGIGILLSMVLRNRDKTPKSEKIDLETKPEDAIEALIHFAGKQGINVSSFEEDLERALKYLADDPYAFQNSLDNLAMRINVQIDRRRRGTTVTSSEMGDGEYPYEGYYEEGSQEGYYEDGSYEEGYYEDRTYEEDYYDEHDYDEYFRFQDEIEEPTTSEDDLHHDVPSAVESSEPDLHTPIIEEDKGSFEQPPLPPPPDELEPIIETTTVKRPAEPVVTKPINVTPVVSMPLPPGLNASDLKGYDASTLKKLLHQEKTNGFSPPPSTENVAIPPSTTLPESNEIEDNSEKRDESDDKIALPNWEGNVEKATNGGVDLEDTSEKKVESVESKAASEEEGDVDSSNVEGDDAEHISEILEKKEESDTQMVKEESGNKPAVVDDDLFDDMMKMLNTSSDKIENIDINHNSNPTDILIENSLIERQHNPTNLNRNNGCSREKKEILGIGGDRCE